MPPGYHCPYCKSEDVYVSETYIECAECESSFSIESIESDIDEENIVAEEELDAIAGAFSEEERKKIIDSLDEDFS